MAEQAKKAVCRWCHARCRVVVHSQDGRLVRIKEDSSDPRVGQIFPPTRGCVRLAGAREYVYHRDRVRFPLKRKGDRGENRWERITWEQALDEIAGKLKEISDRFGPESLMVTTGTGRTTYWAVERFMNVFGCPNIVGQASICFGPAVSAAAAMLGWPLRSRTVFVINDTTTSVFEGPKAASTTKCALVIGMGPSQAYLRFWKSIKEAKKLGAKIIVIDPRRTQTAELADIWLQLRPGTDTALLMSMIKVVIEEELYDTEFVQKWCYGFDGVAERAREYPPDRMSEITWVPAEKIREAARMYATQKPGVCLHGMGLEHLENSLEGIQARLILNAIVGNIDVKGGDYVPGSISQGSQLDMDLAGMLSPEQRMKQIGADRFKLISWPGRELIWEHSKRLWGRTSTAPAYANFPLVLRAILTGEPYPVRAGITVASNPMITQANTKLVYKALKSLDLYVVKDFWLTPSARLADYVLPTTCWLERPEPRATEGYNNKIISGEAALPAIIPGEYEYWTDYEFFRGLGLRLGQEKYWPWQSLDEVCDYTLQTRGLTFKEFMEKENGLRLPPDEYKKHEKMGGFGTPTGKLELSSTILERLGYDPLPHYEEPKESPVSRPDLARDYPLMLITGGRFLPYFHSEHRQVESVRKRHPQPRVQIHPDTAAELGIKDGDWVWIETLRGRVRQRCLYFAGIHPRVVHAQHGWWFPELPGEEPWMGGVWESNINVVMDDDPDRCNPRGGGWPLKTALCKVYKCKTY